MAMTQANAICIERGTAFGPEYFNRLYSGVRRNLSVLVRFFCMTEIREGLHPEIEVLDLPGEPWLEENERRAGETELLLRDEEGVAVLARNDPRSERVASGV